MAVFGQNRFRMKLHTFDWKMLVAHTHDFAIIGPGGDFQALRQTCAFDHQRVIARGLERTWQIAKNSLLCVLDVRSLAVHQSLGVHDPAAKGLADALVAEAHAEYGDFPGKAPDQRHRHPGFIGRAGTRRNHDVLGLERCDFLQRDFVVAVDHDFLSQLAQILHQVVGERIIVVYH